MDENGDMQAQQPLERPKAANIIGLLTIIFCGLGLLSGISGLVTNPLFNEMGMMVFKSEGWETSIMESLKTMVISSILIGIVVSAVGLVGGIGLRKDQKWAPLAAMAFAVLSIASAIYYQAAIAELMNDFLFQMTLLQGQLPMDSPETLTAMKGTMEVSTIVGTIIACIYPAIVLIIMNRNDVKEYYAAQE